MLYVIYVRARTRKTQHTANISNFVIYLRFHGVLGM